MKTKSSVNKAMKEMLNHLPENMTWEDLQYHIYVRQKIEKGLNAISKGDVVPHSKVIRQLRKWIIVEDPFFADKTVWKGTAPRDGGLHHDNYLY